MPKSSGSEGARLCLKDQPQQAQVHLRLQLEALHEPELGAPASLPANL